MFAPGEPRHKEAVEKKSACVRVGARAFNISDVVVPSRMGKRVVQDDACPDHGISGMFNCLPHGSVKCSRVCFVLG